MSDPNKELADEIMKCSAGIMDSLEYALNQARNAGGTAGYKHGSRLKSFKNIVDLAKQISPDLESTGVYAVRQVQAQEDLVEEEKQTGLLGRLLSLPMEKRVKAIYQDVESKTDAFANIDPHDLANALGLCTEDRTMWNQGQLCYAVRMPAEEYADCNGVLELIEHLRGKVSDERFAEISRVAMDSEKSGKSDVEFLKLEEKNLVERLICQDMLQGNLENGMCYLLRHEIILGDCELYFEADGEDDGSVITVRTPYDYRDGHFVDLDDCLTEEW